MYGAGPRVFRGGRSPNRAGSDGSGNPLPIICPLGGRRKGPRAGSLIRLYWAVARYAGFANGGLSLTGKVVWRTQAARWRR